MRVPGCIRHYRRRTFGPEGRRCFVRARRCPRRFWRRRFAAGWRSLIGSCAGSLGIFRLDCCQVDSAQTRGADVGLPRGGDEDMTLTRRSPYLVGCLSCGNRDPPARGLGACRKLWKSQSAPELPPRRTLDGASGVLRCCAGRCQTDRRLADRANESELSTSLLSLSSKEQEKLGLVLQESRIPGCAR